MNTGANNEQQFPMVSIFCMVYNHEPFLRRCLEGFTMQKCNFSFQVVIGEDCSTDNSRNIILEFYAKYPKLFKLLLHPKNIGARQNQKAIFDNCDGKYIAMCEGDDYWTNPFKLQKQVDFLERNQDYIMTCHGIDELRDNVIHKADWRWNKNRNKYKLQDYLYQLFFHTSSVVYRNIELPEYISSPKILNGDIAIFSYILTKGNLFYFNDVMSVYRMHDGGISNSSLHRIDSKVYMSKMFIFENINKVTNFKFSKLIYLNFKIEKEIMLMRSRENSYNTNRFKYWIYKLIYKFLLLFYK
jgi:glycosyltransferase involved in cell wall biosynthesis